MIEAMAASLATCVNDRDFMRVHKQAEDAIIPLELSYLMRSAASLPVLTQRWLKKFAVFSPGVGEHPQQYRRRIFHKGVALYANPDIPKRDKQLIVACCGSTGRLMMPIVSLLQHLPSTRFDVAILRDTTISHYLNGIPGYARDMPTLARRLRADLHVDDYPGLICYGTSMGGFPALRCGMLLGAGRSVAVGGRFPWHLARLQGRTEAPIPAFDLLCSCVPTPAHSSMIVIYGAENETDRLGVERLSRTQRIISIAVPGIEAHCVVLEFFNAGLLAEFYGFVFGWRETLPKLSLQKERCGFSAGMRVGDAPQGILAAASPG